MIKVTCACGCGEYRNKYDRKGRERKFIAGHQRRKVGNLNVIEKTIREQGTLPKAALKLGVSKTGLRKLLKRNNINYINDLLTVRGNSSFGRKAELDALKLLDAQDINGNDPHKAPYDLLWDDLRKKPITVYHGRMD